MDRSRPRRLEQAGVGVKYRVLGPVEVQVDGKVLDLGPKKQRSLFALLLINHNRTVATDRILDALWGDDAGGKENALWVYISRLRSILSEISADEILVTKDHGYAIEINPTDLDAVQFERLVEQGTSLLESDPNGAAQSLSEALDLWRGNPLEEFTYEQFARQEIARLSSKRSTCFDARIEADLLRGRSGELIGELEQQADERPYDETPMRQLMVALYRAGRQTEALRSFERYRKRLAKDTGTDPSPELRRLEEQILFHDAGLARTAGTEPAEYVANPYRGLEAFREEDSNLFFGRDRLIAQLIRTIDEHSLVTVIGPSGSGKSSVVRSGMIPAVRKGAVEGSDEWLVASMLPGSHPFIELEAALLRSRLDAPDSLREQLDGQPDEILRAALRMAPTEISTILVVVDQFEELFTSCSSDEAERFLTAVVEAAADHRWRIRFVLTLRADFYDRLLMHAEFGNAIAGGIVNVVPMAPEELEAAAAGPAARAGVRLEPGLEAALIGDVLGEPGALPLFEFALADLFDRRVGDTLTLQAYRTMGGIDGALSRTADRLYERLTAAQKAAAHQVFLRLVSITEGETRSRRRVVASELLGLEMEVTDLQAVLDAFGKERLLSFDRSPVTGSPTVEVAHEALLERWSRLSAWIAEAQDDVRRNARLSDLATEWTEHDCDDAYLLAAGRLEEYSTWADVSSLTLARPEREFLDASLQAFDDRDREESERAAREVATARRARRNAVGLIAVVLTVVLAGTYLIWAAIQPEGPTVALVHAGEDGGIGSMVKTGFDRAAADLGIVAREEVTLSEMGQRLRELAEGGTDLIIGGLDFRPFIDEIHEDYPDTRFLAIDTLGQGYENVSAATFDDHGGSFAVGAAAALASETGKVGIVIGTQNFFMTQFAGGFEAGAWSVDPDAEVLIDFVSSEFIAHPIWVIAPAGWFAPDDAYRAAWNMYEHGADVVFGAAGAAGEGVIRAAAEFSDQNGRHVWAIGVDIDEGFTSDDAWSDHVLTSMIKRWDEAVYQSISAFLEGTLEPTMVMGFHNDGISFSTYGGHLDPYLEQLESVTAQLAHESRTSEYHSFQWNAFSPISWRDAAADSVRMTFDGEDLTFLRQPAVVAGDIVEFVIANETDEWMGCGVGFVPTGTSDGDLVSASEVSGPLGQPVLDVGGIITTDWASGPRSETTLRSVVPGPPLVDEPMGAGAVACWPTSDWTAFVQAPLYPIEG